MEAKGREAGRRKHSVECRLTWGKWGPMALERGRMPLQVVSADMAAGSVLQQPLPQWLRASLPALAGPEQPLRLWENPRQKAESCCWLRPWDSAWRLGCAHSHN